jgi:chromate transporter
MDSLSVLLELALVFGRLGALSFGGGLATLAEMQRTVVGHGWLTESQFVEAYALGQMAPASAMMMVVPIGYQAAGLAGAVVAFVAFFSPPALIAVVVAGLWGRVRESPWPTAFRRALIPITVGMTASSALTLLIGGLGDVRSILIALTVFVLLLRTSAPMPLVLIGGGVLGTAFLQP